MIFAQKNEAKKEAKYLFEEFVCVMEHDEYKKIRDEVWEYLDELSRKYMWPILLSPENIITQLEWQTGNYGRNNYIGLHQIFPEKFYHAEFRMITVRDRSQLDRLLRSLAAQFARFTRRRLPEKFFFTKKFVPLQKIYTYPDGGTYEYHENHFYFFDFSKLTQAMAYLTDKQMEEIAKLYEKFLEITSPLP